MELASVSDVLECILGEASSEGRKASLVEIGGGSGFLASRLSTMGFEVRCFDPAPREPVWYPVSVGWGHEIPVPDGNADVALSSQVLEHIPEPFLGRTLDEVRRVLRPGGRAIMLVPSSSCMLLTILLQPLARLRSLLRLPGRLIRRLRKGRRSEYRRPRNSNPLCARAEWFPAKLLKEATLRWFLPPPHGAGRTALHELLQWRSARWKRTLEARGFAVELVRPSGLAGSLHQLSGNQAWGRALRRLLGMMGLSATNAFVARPRTVQGGVPALRGEVSRAR